MRRVLLALLLLHATSVAAQTMAVMQGRVTDPAGGAVPGASIKVHDPANGFESTGLSDGEGRYHVAAIPPGTYQVTVEIPGFRTVRIEAAVLEVGRTLVRDFPLTIDTQREAVVVRAGLPLLDRATSTVGHVVTAQTVQHIPLNGRHFVDLGPLVPGSVAPSQTGFSTTPIRGTGALAFNSTGNREEAVAYIVNGVTTNNLTFGSIGFPPPVASIQEFKIDNSTFSAEYGHVSGAVVNLVTRAGTDRYRGEAYEFFRDEALDARNFFEFTSDEPHPFERHQFGGAAGGPLIRGRTHFFATYEGLRQRQGIDMNGVVLTDAQRAAATGPVITRLLPLIPRPNYFDADGTPRFVGAADARVDENTWTADVRHHAGTRDRILFYYGRQRISGVEPGAGGNNVPGFGQQRAITKGTLTVTATHLFDRDVINEARFGRTMQDGGTFPATALNPEDFGIANGVNRPIGLPQMIIAGALNFGGPSNLPAGRHDTLYVVNDTVTAMAGRHAIKAGGEFRRFHNNNFAEGTGQFSFPSVAAFLAGTANAFSITLGERRSRIVQDALSFFAQDSITVGPSLTVDLGLRYEWHMTPIERDHQFVVFDAATVSLLQVGVDLEKIYRENNRNIQPRLGLAWTLTGDGKTVVRAAYGHAVDQPGTTTVNGTAGNPPFATPLTASGAIPLRAAVSLTQPIGLAPATVDPNYRNASLRSWNVNLQRELGADLAATIAYFGARGHDLRIARNLNQPVNGVRPFPALSAASPIRPGAALGNIMQMESTGFSRYDALSLIGTKRLSGGLQFDTSYTWSKSLDTNSLNSSNFNVQDGYDIPNQYGLSDFDARHRFVMSAVYQLPFAGSAWTRDWQIAAIVQSQSGNPVNVVTSNATLNGVPNTVRPDLIAPIQIIGSVDQWFDPASFAAVNRFGNLGRNVVTGPAFHNTDLSVSKALTIADRYRVQLRADAFDLFNHPNFGPPGNIVGSPTFGKISRTRLPTGEAGSSRQIQLVAKLSF
jgi:hypothetical protein